MDFKYLKAFSILILTLINQITFAQSDASILIDGKPTFFRQELSLPYWLKAGQVVNIGTNVSSISAIEFTIDTTNQNLVFSQVLSITKSSVVPRNRTWKIEALGFNGSKNIDLPVTHTSPKTFGSPGVFYWIVPPTINKICVELWGGGGYGSLSDLNVPYTGAGGGGGAYGYQCLDVTPGQVFRIKISDAAGDSTVFGSLLYATSGQSAVDSVGGLGGKSNATFNVKGLNGLNGGKYKPAGKGGDCPFGGSGLYPLNCSGYNYNGGLTTYPGGGGFGSTLCGNIYGLYRLDNGGSSGGKLVIYW